MKKIVFKKIIDFESKETVCDFLAENTGLSKVKIKDAMQKGALHIKKERGSYKRQRRAKAILVKGSTIEFYYDEKLLDTTPLHASLLHDEADFSVWFKPSGMLTQGTKYGDHASLMRSVELYFKQSREVYLIHRLDREASGIVLVGHTKKAASKLSHLFTINKIEKEYKVQVLGRLEGEGLIDRPLDGKKALTRYKVTANDPQNRTSVLDITIETGRLHQIRRHLDMIGHAVMGDPRYGHGNKNREGMKLVATRLSFHSPFTGKKMDFKIPGELLEW